MAAVTLEHVVKELRENRRSTDAVNSNIAEMLAQAQQARLQQRETAYETARNSVKSGAKNSLNSISTGARGMMGGIGRIGMLGAAAAGAAAAFAGLALIDADKIKHNVETLLSLGERYDENTIANILTDGAVIVGLNALGKSLLMFAAGGALNAGVQYFTDGLWAQQVKDNVTTLLSIADISSASQLAQMLFSGAAVPLALRGLGIGLGLFGIGQALTGLGQWVTDTTWAEQVKANVLTLLSIADGPLANIGMLLESALFVPAMTGLAIGLGVFAVGQAATGLAQFITADGWAQQVKDNVLTLLSISNILGGAGSFIGSSAVFLTAMTGIGLGLAAFGVGAIITGGADMLADWFAPGEGRGDWTQVVYDNVQKLLSISKIDGIGWDTAKFVAVMGGISSGLLAFGVAGAGVSALDALADWMSPGEGRGNWTQEVYDNVANVLSILDLLGDSPATRALQFTAAMSAISSGLVAFAAGTFISGLANAASSILSFFTGGESAFDQVMKVADNAEQLQTGAAAVDSLTNSLEKLGQLQFDGSNLNLQEMAEDLARAVPVIETAIMGGSFDDSWLPFTAQDIKGLADPTINYDDAVRNINNLREVLGLPTSVRVIPNTSMPTDLSGGSAGGAPVTINVVNTDASTTVGGTNVSNTSVTSGGRINTGYDDIGIYGP